MTSQVQEEMEWNNFSVVIPTYNRSLYLRELLKHLLMQDYPKDKHEIVVVDDGSTDGTETLANTVVGEIDIAIRYYRQDHKGPAAARNLGIRKSEFDIVAFTDDDCRPDRDWLSKLNSYFVKDRELVGVGGIQFSSPEDIIPLTHHAPPIHAAIADNARFPGTNNVAYKKSILLEVNGFDENFGYVSAEDADLYIRVSKLGAVIFATELRMRHIARPISLLDAIKGYVNFYNGFQELERRYPREFEKIYRARNTEELFSTPPSERKSKYYFKCLKNPLSLIKFSVYVLSTRGYLLFRKIFG